MPFPFIPLGLAGLSALSGGFGSREQETTTGLDPVSKRFRDLAIAKLFGSVNTDTDFRGFEASGINNINRNADLQRTSLEGILASLGIQGPAAGNAVGRVESDRFSRITGFQNELPLLRKIAKEDALSKFLGTITASADRTQTSPGNVVGSSLGNFANVLAYFNGRRQSEGNNV